MTALEVHIACECNAVPRVATVQKVRTLGMCGAPVRWRRRASYVACWSPTPSPSHQPQVAAQLARAGPTRAIVNILLTGGSIRYTVVTVKP